MDAGELQSLLLYLSHQRLALDYAYVSAVALLIYDYLLTVHLEVSLVWRSDGWSYSKTLFFLARYIPLANSYFILQNQIFPDVAAGTCTWGLKIITWLILSGIVFAEMILMLRTWVVWNRDRRVGITLAAVICGAIIAECICNNRFTESLQIQNPLYPGYRGCFLTNTNRILLVDFVILTVVELIVLAFMGASAWRSYYLGDAYELSNVVHRDGILYYVYLLCFSLANIFVMALLPTDLQILLPPLQGVLYSILTCRICINIRRVGRRDSTETTSSLQPPRPSPMSTIPTFCSDPIPQGSWMLLSSPV